MEIFVFLRVLQIVFKNVFNTVFKRVRTRKLQTSKVPENGLKDYPHNKSKHRRCLNIVGNICLKRIQKSKVDSHLCFPDPMPLACWVHKCVTAPGTARGWRKWCRHLQQNGCAAQWSLEIVWRKTHGALPGAGASAAATSNKIGNYHRTRCCH